jgi:hypothetical protein
MVKADIHEATCPVTGSVKCAKRSIALDVMMKMTIGASQSGYASASAGPLMIAQLSARAMM